jgi:hypothetical protein
MLDGVRDIINKLDNQIEELALLKRVIILRDKEIREYRFYSEEDKELYKANNEKAKVNLEEQIESYKQSFGIKTT